MNESMRDGRLTLDQNKRLSRCRLLGVATALPVVLTDTEMSKLIRIIISDVNADNITASRVPALPENSDYYHVPMTWFEETMTEKFDVVGIYKECSEKISEFEIYFECLCELHKRRKKYARILESQPLPTMLQISPRALLEFGELDVSALASWLTWRKWLYDIDNRAAQETGYLFEPILANALGGEPFSAKKSPVKKSDDDRRGRQVDCIVGDRAYEFKLRVTIAASGQGRFAEELSFATDCYSSGFKPVLLVLDPTPSARLDDLSAEYEKCGGFALTGEEAWDHIEREAGHTMAVFIEYYVRRPISEIDASSSELLNLALSSDEDTGELTITLGTHSWLVKRAD